MPRISNWFFAVAVLYALIGMLLGMYMGAAENLTLAPAHAHWNLLGWVGNAIYGTFFALAGERVPKRLPGIVFALANLGAIVLILALALFLLGGNDPAYIPEIVAGEILTVSGMAAFAIAVWSVLLKKA